MSVHQPGNGNYENGILRHKDGYSCNKCGENVKTMGLIRRHMKTIHGINIMPTEDGARSIPSQSSFRIKCDLCNFKAETKDELLKHLDVNHTPPKEKCNICQMVAENKTHLMKHMQSHQNRNNFNNPKINMWPTLK